MEYVMHWVPKNFMFGCIFWAAVVVLKLEVQECNSLVFVRSLTRHLCWEKTVWIISNHLAVRLRLDSTLSKGSVWDVELPGHSVLAG